ncbi:MAG: DUF3054 domain-containing protein [Kineosporiaceae bacterium]
MRVPSTWLWFLGGSRGRATLTSIGVDGAAVVVFAVAGRLVHGEPMTVAGMAGTAWPFLVGLGLGWAGLVGLRLHPRRRLAAALPITGTVLFGLLIRRLVQTTGTPFAFVVVTVLVVSLLLLGWRTADLAMRRRVHPVPG